METVLFRGRLGKRNTGRHVTQVNYNSTYLFPVFLSGKAESDFLFRLPFPPFPPFPFALGPFFSFSFRDDSARRERELARVERRDVDRSDLMVPWMKEAISSPSLLLSKDECSYSSTDPYITRSQK